MQARHEVKVMKEKVKRHAITGVFVETLGGAAEVSVSPRELSRAERKRVLSRPARSPHPVKVANIVPFR